MSDERVRTAFREGLRPFVEPSPDGPSFDDLAVAPLAPVRTGSTRVIMAGVGVLAAVGVFAVVVGGPPDTTELTSAKAAGLGEDWWRAVANADFPAARAVMHPLSMDLDLELIHDEYVAPLGEPVAVELEGEFFGSDQLPELCYSLEGPDGVARGSIVFRQDGGEWLVWEFRPEMSRCTFAPPTTTIPELRDFPISSFIRSVIPEQFTEHRGEVSTVALLPDVSLGQALRTVEELTGVAAVEIVPADRIRVLADEFAAGRRLASLEGEWVAIGLVAEYIDTDIVVWRDALERIDGVFVERVETSTMRPFRIPPGWERVAEIDISDQEIARAIPTDLGILVITRRSETLLVGYDGSVTRGEPAPESPFDVVDNFRPMGHVAGKVVLWGSSWHVFDTRSLSWARIEAPSPGRVLGSAVISGELYLVGSGSEPALVVFDPEAMAWRELEPVPASINVGDVTTDGQSLYVAGVRQGEGNMIIGPSRNPALFRYDPGPGWIQLPSIPIDGQAPGIGWADELGLIGWNYDHDAAVFRDGEWERLPDHPFACESYPRAQTIPGGMFGQLCAEWLTFDSATREWNEVHVPGWEALLAPDGSAIYVLTPTGESSVLHRYDLDR